MRVARTEDAGALLEIYAPAVLDGATSFELEVPSEAEFAGRIERVLATHPWFVAEDEAGAALGYAYAVPFRGRPAYAWCAECSVYVAEHARRAGVARALYAELLRTLRELGYHLAVAGVTLPNPASVAFHERLGFRPVGVVPEVGWKHGAWHGVGFWSLHLREPGAPVDTPPLPFSTEP